jgi:hypothetical protein
MLNGVRLPKKAMMVAFLSACGVQDDGMESWQHAWERVAVGKERKHHRPVASSWHFSDPGPVTLICPQLPREETSSLADPADPNYTGLLSYADLDSLVELHGHIRAENPDMEVFFKQFSQFDSTDLSGHLVLIGGIAWNEATERVSGLAQLPIRQVRDPAIQTGEIFVVEHNGEEQKFIPQWSGDSSELIEDVGLIARMRNPFNSTRTLTLCNGVHSRGVLGAVRTLTDARLRQTNETHITESFADSSTFAILMRVPVIGGRTVTPDFRAKDCILYQWPA